MKNNEPQPSESTSRDGEKRSAGNLARSAAWSSLGWQLLLTFVIFVAAGRWIDGQFDSEPWGVLGGCLLGFIALIVRAQQESNRS